MILPEINRGITLKPDIYNIYIYIFVGNTYDVRTQNIQGYKKVEIQLIVTIQIYK